MPDWYIYNFECGTQEQAEKLLDALTENGEFEPPDDFSPVATDGGQQPESEAERRERFREILAKKVQEHTPDRLSADAAIVGDMLYVHTRWDAPQLLSGYVRFWERAVYGVFDGTKEVVKEASLYTSGSYGPHLEQTYQGQQRHGGLDILYTFEQEHDFRFRAYARQSPTPLQLSHIPGAGDELTLTFEENGDDDLRETLEWAKGFILGNAPDQPELTEVDALDQ